MSGQTYVRYDGGTDQTIEDCNNHDPAVFGARTQNNEPFSVVDPQNPDLVLAGWNDYCSGWMGLGFSIDGGQAWTNSLVPGYPADTSAGGMASPEYLRTNAAGVAALTLAAHSELQGDPDGLLARLQATARNDMTNYMGPNDPNNKSDSAIRHADAYGAGIVDAAGAVSP